MEIYDISQEVFSCKVYPGDPAPERKVIESMEQGSICNLTAFSMCAHNGTHIDAPFHFVKDGETVDGISLESFVGECIVVEHQGIFTAEDAKKALQASEEKRILIKGKATVSPEAARVFAEEGILLLGNESQTVGPEDAPAEVHKLLLSCGTVLLEGIRLDVVEPGKYFLNAAPINLAGADGAPCRAILIRI